MTSLRKQATLYPQHGHAGALIGSGATAVTEKVIRTSLPALTKRLFSIRT